MKEVVRVIFCEMTTPIAPIDSTPVESTKHSVRDILINILLVEKNVYTSKIFLYNHTKKVYILKNIQYNINIKCYIM